MKIGEVKAEALHLMFATQGEELDPSDMIDLVGSEAYGSYLVAMTGSINRCLADLEIKEIPYPSRIYRLSTDDTKKEDSGYAVVDLKEKIPDLLKIIRVCDFRYLADIRKEMPYHLEGNLMILPSCNSEKETRVVVYRPCLPRITPTTDPSEELPISDRISAWIPYWIVGELFREDEPELAAEMMNRYQTKMQDILNEVQPTQTAVVSVFSMEA